MNTTHTANMAAAMLRAAVAAAALALMPHAAWAAPAPGDTALLRQHQLCDFIGARWHEAAGLLADGQPGAFHKAQVQARGAPAQLTYDGNASHIRFIKTGGKTIILEAQFSARRWDPALQKKDVFLRLLGAATEEQPGNVSGACDGDRVTATFAGNDLLDVTVTARHVE